jgi:hypothetical protein
MRVFSLFLFQPIQLSPATPPAPCLPLFGYCCSAIPDEAFDQLDR